MLFVIQRGDACRFRPADHIDPAFGTTLRDAQQQGGIEILAHRCAVELAGIRWDRAIPVDLS